MRDKIYRIFPCAANDVLAMEKWLSEMAAQGWHLCNEGLSFGIAVFQKGEPKKVYYRLDVKRAEWVRKKSGRFNDEEQKEAHIANGWEYVADRGAFNIYRSETKMDMYNVNSERISEIQRHKRNEWINTIASFVVLLLLPFIDLDGAAMMITAQIGLPLVLLSLLLIAAYIMNHISKAVRWSRYLEVVRTEEGFEHTVRVNAARYYIRLLGIVLLIGSWSGLMIYRLVTDDQYEIPLAECEKDMPFPTIEDMVFMGGASAVDEPINAAVEYAIDDSMGIANTVRDVSTWIAPQVYEWEEIARAESADGSVTEGSLYVDYYEMRYEWMAKWLIHEFHWTSEREGELHVNLENLDVDYAEAYIGLVHMPTLIIQDGNTIVKVEFNSYNTTDAFDIEQWAMLVAESLR